MSSSVAARTIRCLAIGLTCAVTRIGAEGAAPPLDPGLKESIEQRLIQFEIRVSQKGDPVRGLTAADLDIELSGKPLAFTLDDMCPGEPQPAPKPGSFLLYFDDPELTFEGRHRAVEVARLVAPKLLAPGHDILVLRNGAALYAETKWTRDLAEVNAALDRIAAAPAGMDPLQGAHTELRAEALLERVRNVVREAEYGRALSHEEAISASLNAPIDPDVVACGPGGSPARLPSPAAKLAAQNAAMYSRQGDNAVSGLVMELSDMVDKELQRSGRDIERLRAALRSLASRGSPKGIVYFADTLRGNPGGVVQQALESVPQFNNRNRSDLKQTGGSRTLAAVSSWNADGDLATLTADASTHGARFYAIEGRGLGMPSDWVRTAQDTLTSMALETGGLSFVNGVAESKIAERIEADQACWYLVSFDPAGWATDRTMGLGVWPKSRGRRVAAPSAIVIPGRDRLIQDRLLAAHLGDPMQDVLPLSVAAYPVGGTARQFQVLAQVRLPEEELPASDTAWDVGVEVIAGGAVVAQASDRLQWRTGGRPPIYQAALTIPRGPYEIVAVAREAGSDAIGQGRMLGTWPALSVDRIQLGRTVIAQPEKGGIVEKGEVKTSGIAVRGKDDPVDPRLAASIVTAACFAGANEPLLRAERTLAGQSTVSFDPITLSRDGGRCVQIRDLVAAGSLGAGRLTYSLRILSGDAEIATQEMTFEVADEP